jgi:hypothetical protein
MEGARAEESAEDSEEAKAGAGEGVEATAVATEEAATVEGMGTARKGARSTLPNNYTPELNHPRWWGNWRRVLQAGSEGPARGCARERSAPTRTECACSRRVRAGSKGVKLTQCGPGAKHGTIGNL